ncbi:MAG: type II toxin-antitoxin system RelE/ParE family toxin [Deltaproteobacteria bacterium]|nr:type II toxin-antitoxin system RelE/ParE family toxin [Deltaproteobacteria bacterium]
MAQLYITELAEADIAGVLSHTLERWGAAQYARYGELIELALADLAANPGCGGLRSEIRPGLRAHHIKRPGRNARHILFYRVERDEHVVVLRLLHDHMDFARHLPE